MPDASDYVDGGSVDWSGLAYALVGSVTLSAVLGFAGVLTDSVAFVISALSSVDSWFMALSNDVSGILVHGLRMSTEPWQSFVSLFGPAAFPVAVLAVIGIVYVFHAGVSRYV